MVDYANRIELTTIFSLVLVQQSKGRRMNMQQLVRPMAFHMCSTKNSGGLRDCCGSWYVLDCLFTAFGL